MQESAATAVDRNASAQLESKPLDREKVPEVRNFSVCWVSSAPAMEKALGW